MAQAPGQVWRYSNQFHKQQCKGKGNRVKTIEETPQLNMPESLSLNDIFCSCQITHEMAALVVPLQLDWWWIEMLIFQLTVKGCHGNSKCWILNSGSSSCTVVLLICASLLSSIAALQTCLLSCFKIKIFRTPAGSEGVGGFSLAKWLKWHLGWYLGLTFAQIEALCFV